MNIGVLGCGSLGGVIAAKLWEYHGGNVVVFELNPDIVSNVKQNGLTVIDGEKGFVARPRILSGIDALENPLDLIILTTKSTTLVKAVEAYLPALKPGGCFMTVQNGLMALDLIERYGNERIVAGSVMWGASMTGPGRYEITAKGPFVVGGIDGRRNTQAELCMKALVPAFPVNYSPDMRDILWTKLTVTASLTSLGAISGLSFGEMLKDRTVRELILRVGEEVVAVGKASGVAFKHAEGALNVNLMTGSGFPPAFVRHLLVRAIGLKHRHTESSMLASLKAGAVTEVDMVNGVIVDFGKRYGIETPVNAAIVSAVKELENGTEKPGDDCFRKFVSLLGEFT